MRCDIQFIKERFAPLQPLKVNRLEKAFEDSTHNLYTTEGLNSKAFIKVFSPLAFQAGAFWQGMQLLFDFELDQQLSQFDTFYQVYQPISQLTLPPLLSCQNTEDRQMLAFQFLQAATIKMPTVEIIQQLARHLADCHQQKHKGFGYLFAPQSVDWQTHLTKQLPTLLKALPETEIQRLSDQISPHFACESFAPIMPDLRWDQFLLDETGDLILTDLDAIVLGPPEFEWVLLEYLIPDKYAELFIESYRQQATPPVLEKVREVYRAILFCMNVLGEQNYQAWCKQPHLFD